MTYATPESLDKERPITEVAQSLSQLLLDKSATIASVVGLPNRQAVRPWLEGRGDDPTIEKRLRVAEHLAQTVQDDRRPWVSQAWLIGANPHLGEHAPAEWIASLQGSEADDETVRRLQVAANTFGQTA